MTKKSVNSAPLKLEVGALSETGYVRNENQDRMSGAAIPLGYLYIVADGMGGHKGGALAAELTIKGLQRHIGKAAADASIETVLQNAFTAVNAEVHHKANCGDPATAKMGSTAVLAMIRDGAAWLAHVGDSRAYLYRKGTLDLLTKDHTWVQMMVDKGVLKAEDAQNHPNSSQLSRAVGHQADIEVDISNEIDLKEGDAILLCSDGLSGYVSDPEIVAVLEGGFSVQQIPKRLVRLALKKGGEDNVTVQFIQYGRRPGTQKNKLQETAKRIPKEPKLQIRPAFQWILALLIFTTIGLIGYFNLENIELRESATIMEMKAKNLGRTIENMKKKAEKKSQNIKDSEKLQNEIVQLKNKLTAEQNKAKNQSKDLKAAENSRDSYKKKYEDTKEELEGTEKELKGTKKQLNAAKDELVKLKAAENEPDAHQENQQSEKKEPENTGTKAEQTNTNEQHLQESKPEPE